MLETLSGGFRAAKNLLNNERQLTEENIAKALKSVRMSLLQADVHYDIAKDFVQKVQQQALGTSVKLVARDKNNQKIKLSPADHFISICHDELVKLMGPVDTSIKLSKPIGTVMMVGLQGVGKTTTSAKIAQRLKKQGHKPMLVAADIYRPAAVLQLQKLAQELQLEVYHDEQLSPAQLCQQAPIEAKIRGCDVAIFDTAGRLTIDDQLMAELEQIKQSTCPDNILLVVDAMSGQDAVNSAKEFNNLLDIDGFILTKLDGDARGGAALSIKYTTNKPIKFLGSGEKLTDLEEFRPKGLADRILGFGDIVGLVNDLQEHIDEKKAEKDAARMLGGDFTFEDFLQQLRTIKKMGSLGSIMEKMPFFGQGKPTNIDEDEKLLLKFESIILSMTKKEKSSPETIAKNKSRIERIAKGSGRKESDVYQLLQRYKMMKKMMQAFSSKPNMLKKIPGLKNLGSIADMAKAQQGLGQPDFEDVPSLMSPSQNLGLNSSAMMSPGGFAGGFDDDVRPVKQLSAKQIRSKKNKRKQEKLSRKKNKKRKK